MLKRREKLVRQRKLEVLGLLLMTFGVLLLLAMLTHQPTEVPGKVTLAQTRNAMGIVGAYLSYYVIHYTFGYAAITLPFLFLAWGWNRFRRNEPSELLHWTPYVILLSLYVAVVMAVPEVLHRNDGAYDLRLGGVVGRVVAMQTVAWLGLAGTVIVLFALALILFSAATHVSLSGWVSSVTGYWADVRMTLERELNRWRHERVRKRLAEQEAEWGTAAREETGQPIVRPQESMRAEEGRLPGSAERTSFRVVPAEDKSPLAARVTPLRVARQLELPIVEETEQESFEASFAPERYQFPPVDLLLPSEPPDELTDVELRDNARVLEQALLEFGVEARVVEISPGPVITRYEVEPAPGVKVAQILSLSNDLARMLRAHSIRIVAPIPGKAAVGIEIPNRNPALVRLREIIESAPFVESSSVLSVALGRTISGKPYVTDLARMPHLLVAGATGSGKSVCLNTIITSILYKARPDQVQFIMIDPKRLELSMYDRLREHHVTYLEGLDSAVVTTPANAIAVLRAVEYEMDRRYELLAHAGVRSMEDYNEKVLEGSVKAENGEPLETLPNLIVIIDELADLMLTGAKDVEEPIARLTQMSRAVGIHLVVATQRPSVDVITGVIKANFPARIAFRVSSKTDSRTILDMNGAEKLLGRGDMLFVPPGSPEPVRVHGAYISTEESESIIEWIASQPRFPKEPLVPYTEALSKEGEGYRVGERDELFEEAARLVVRHQQGSISLLQRRLKIGYSRAARLIDELEEAGVVGPFDGSKAREVLVDEEGLMAMGIAPYGGR